MLVIRSKNEGFGMKNESKSINIAREPIVIANLNFFFCLFSNCWDFKT